MVYGPFLFPKSFGSPRIRAFCSFTVYKSFYRTKNLSLDLQFISPHPRFLEKTIYVDSFKGPRQLCSTQRNSGILLNYTPSTPSIMNRIRFRTFSRHRTINPFYGSSHFTSILATILCRPSQPYIPSASPIVFESGTHSINSTNLSSTPFVSLLTKHRHNTSILATKISSSTIHLFLNTAKLFNDLLSALNPRLT